MVFKSEPMAEGASAAAAAACVWKRSRGRGGVPHLRGRPRSLSLCSQTKGLFPAALRDHLLRLNQHVLNAVCTL